jgi:hypothetical protein
MVTTYSSSRPPHFIFQRGCALKEWSRWGSVVVTIPVSLATLFRGPTGPDHYTQTQVTVTGTSGLAAVHTLHTADHAKHVANAAAVAAFTAIAGVRTEQVLNWSGLPLISRVAMGLRAIRKGMVKRAVGVPL